MVSTIIEAPVDSTKEHIQKQTQVYDDLFGIGKSSPGIFFLTEIHISENSGWYITQHHAYKLWKINNRHPTFSADAKT